MNNDDVTMSEVPGALEAAAVFMGAPVTARAPNEEEASVYLLNQFHADGSPVHDLDISIGLVLPDALRAAEKGASDWLDQIVIHQFRQYAVPVPHYAPGTGRSTGAPERWGLLTVDLRNMEVPTVGYQAPTDDAAKAEALKAEAEEMVQPLLDALLDGDGEQIGFDYLPLRLAGEPDNAAQNLEMVRGATFNFALSAAPVYGDVMDLDMADADQAEPSMDFGMADLDPAGPALGTIEWMGDEHIEAGLRRLAAQYPDLQKSAVLMPPLDVQMLRGANWGEDFGALGRLIDPNITDVFLPINDRSLHYEADGSEGKHWSLLRLQAPGASDEPSLLRPTYEGYHYNSLAEGALAEEHARIAQDLIWKANAYSVSEGDMHACSATQQANGHQCGDYVLAMIDAQLEQLRADPGSRAPADCTVIVPARNTENEKEPQDREGQEPKKHEVRGTGYPELSEEEVTRFVEAAIKKLGPLEEYYAQVRKKQEALRSYGAENRAASIVQRDISNIFETAGCPIEPRTRARYSPTLIARLAGIDTKKVSRLNYAIINDGYVPQILAPVADLYVKEVAAAEGKQLPSKPQDIDSSTWRREQIKQANKADFVVRNVALEQLINAVADKKVPGLTLSGNNDSIPTIHRALTASDFSVFCPIDKQNIYKIVARHQTAFARNEVERLKALVPNIPGEARQDLAVRLFKAADELGLERASEIQRLAISTLKEFFPNVKTTYFADAQYFLGPRVWDKVLEKYRLQTGPEADKFIHGIPGVKKCKTLKEVAELAKRAYDELPPIERENLGCTKKQLSFAIKGKRR